MEAVEQRKPPAESALIGIPSDELDAIWPQVADFIEKPLVRTGVIKDYAPRDIYKFLKGTEMQCWIVTQQDKIICVAITQILILPQRKILGVPFIGADEHTISSWLPHIEILKDFGRYHGCKALRGWGRAGWVKLLKPTDVRVEFDLEL